VGITRDEAEEILGRAPDVLVPSDPQIPRAITDGEPIVLANERSVAARAFRSLADFYLQEQRPEPSANGDSPAHARGKRMRLLRREKG
jgi:MinD-like ATPase involved in chromosome partitioning or flagellar assembly